MAWLSGWQYRKSQVINPQTGAGTLYQKLFKIYYGSGTDGNETVGAITARAIYCNNHCRTDFGDIRFTDDDGNTLLDYWIESKVDSSYALIWVEVADSLESAAQTIYVYYGKADATYPYGADQTEMDNTFIFADHFYGTAINTSKWLNDTANAAVSGSIMTLTGDVTAWKKIRSATTAPQGSALRTLAQIVNRTQNKGGIISIQNSPITGNIRMIYFDNLNSIGCYDGNWTSVDSNPDNVQRIWEIFWKTAKATFIKDGTEMTNSPITTNVPTANLSIIFEAVGSTGYEVKVDWCLLRKYVEPEPTYGNTGSEEEHTYEKYKTVVEYLGCLESESEIKSLYRTLVELMSVLDSKIRSVTLHRTFTEYIGALESFISQILGKIVKTFIEYMGMSESKISIKTIYKVFIEYIGLLDSKIKYGSKVFIEYLGLKDRLRKLKHIIKKYLYEYPRQWITSLGSE